MLWEKGEGSNQQPKYRCVVKIALESRTSPLKSKGEGSNPQKNNNNNIAFVGGGPERGNPAMTAKRWRQGVKETHNSNVVGKDKKDIYGVRN